MNQSKISEIQEISTIEDIKNKLGVKRATAIKYIHLLRKKGLVRTIYGKGKRFYRITKVKKNTKNELKQNTYQKPEDVIYVSDAMAYAFGQLKSYYTDLFFSRLRLAYKLNVRKYRVCRRDHRNRKKANSSADNNH